MSASKNPDIYQIRANIIDEERHLGPVWRDVDLASFTKCPPVSRRIVVSKEQFIAATTGRIANASALDYQINKSDAILKQVERLNELLECVFKDIEKMLDQYIEIQKIDPCSAVEALEGVKNGLMLYKDDRSFAEELHLNVIKNKFETALKDERAESFSISASDLRVLVERAK